MVDAPRGTYIAYSTSPGDVAEDGSGKNSPYTAALAKAIVAPGLKLEDAFKEARRLVLAATDNKQLPWEMTSITGDFYFRPPAPQPPQPPAPQPPKVGSVGPAVLPSPGSDDKVNEDTVDKLTQECDTLAANPVDPNRPPSIIGVSLTVLATQSDLAITACTAAVGARQDSPRTTYELGRSYEAGGLFGLAKQWLEKAAALGYAPAVQNLAGMLQKGEGGPVDFAAARQSYEKAAVLGYAPAMHNLGIMLEKGEGGPIDFAAARQWYEKAANLGDAPAMSGLGYMAEKGEGGPVDFATARQWYEKAADLGNAPALNNLGEMLRNGKGGSKDYIGALQLYRRATDLGSPVAMKILGYMAEKGEGGPVDLVSARQWYEKAAELGNAPSMNILGYMEEKGEGGSVDLAKARQWFEKAVALGYAPAIHNLDTMLGNGRPPPAPSLEGASPEPLLPAASPPSAGS